jgi:lipopolysaccharide export system protein LptA
MKQQVREKIKQEVGKAGREQASSTLTVTGDRNSFNVDNEKGQRLLEAKVEHVEGAMRPDQGLQGPVQMRKVSCRLFQNGKHQLDLTAPEATWDGVKLLAGKTAHGVTPNGDTVIDAQKAVWTAEGGELDLNDAKLASIEKGKTTFTAVAARANVDGDIITMPAGGSGNNPEGKRLKADHIRWFRGTGKLEANGNVLVADKDTEVTGQRLTADTRLKKGRFTGKTRVRARAGKISLSKKANG